MALPDMPEDQRERRLLKKWISGRRAITTAILVGLVLIILLFARGWNKVVPAAPPVPIDGPEQQP